MDESKGPYRACGTDTPRYVLGDAATAAGITPGLLKAWVSRQPRVIALGQYDQASRGKGTPRLFTLRRIIAIATTAELVSLGISASKASLCAFSFTDLHFEGKGPPVQWSKTPYLLVSSHDEIFTFVMSEDATVGEIFSKRLPRGVPAKACLFRFRSWRRNY